MDRRGVKARGSARSTERRREYQVSRVREARAIARAGQGLVPMGPALRMADRRARMEQKYFDAYIIQNASTALVSSVLAPAVGTTLFAPAQGSGNTNRDGRRVVVTSITVEGYNLLAPFATTNPLATGPTAPFTPPTICIWLVWDKQTNGTQATGDLVYTGPTAQFAVAPLRNMLYTRRFKVLKKWSIVPDADSITWTTNATSAFTGTIGQRHNFNFYKKVRIPVNFSASNSTPFVADVIDNSFFMMATTNDAASQVNSVYAHIRFTFDEE